MDLNEEVIGTLVQYFGASFDGVVVVYSVQFNGKDCVRTDVTDDRDRDPESKNATLGFEIFDVRPASSVLPLAICHVTVLQIFRVASNRLRHPSAAEKGTMAQHCRLQGQDSSCLASLDFFFLLAVLFVKNRKASSDI